MRLRSLCLLVTLPVTLLSPSAAVAQPAGADVVDESIYNCKPRTASVEITFKPEIELKELLSWAVGFTCKRFVYDPRIVSTGRKVALIAPGKQTPAQAYDMFTTALATLGFTVVPRRTLLEIVETAGGKTKAPQLYKDKLPDASEQVVRYLMRPTHAQPDTLSKALTAFKSDAGDVQPLGAFVLMTDHASNVRDMVTIAKLVDVPGGTDGIYAIPVMHADAAKLLVKIEQLLDVGASGGSSPGSRVPVGRPIGTAEHAVLRETSATPSKILVDERTNTLIVAGTDAAYQRVKALVATLDIALGIEGGTTMHVYQLGSAIADEIAKTLNDAISAQASPSGASGPGGAKPPGSTAPGDLGSLQGPVRVISDPKTNKLLVMASGRDFLSIREVIRELDVPRRQVYIEAMILEVQIDNGRQLGTSSHGGYNYGDSSVLVGGVQAPNLKSTSLESLVSANGLIGGLVGKTLKHSQALLGTSIPSYAILFQALSTNSRTNILSTMPIIVVDNEQAKYQVGTNVPYKKGVMPTSAAANSTISTNIEREKLLLELDIKPHISTDDSILLEVKQSSKDLGSSDPELGPTWSERAVETRVLVRDQQTIVIGGLMQMRDSSSESKVPLLGDIPVLGHLFKYSTKSKKKTNLLILLTPYIIKDHLDLEAIRNRKQREYDEFTGSFRALDGQPYLPRLDYRRKRGVIEEINRTVQDIDAEIAARATLHGPVYVKPGLVEPSAALDVAPTVPTSTAVRTPDVQSLRQAMFVDLPSLQALTTPRP
ncbi:MAG TPA: type II secretion system secretin GspD [Kofleriaceae bacterium]